jgi:hypothetical protein
MLAETPLAEMHRSERTGFNTFLQASANLVRTQKGEEQARILTMHS